MCGDCAERGEGVDRTDGSTTGTPGRATRRQVLAGGIGTAAALRWGLSGGSAASATARVAALTPAAAPAPAAPVVEVIPGLVIHPRDAWGADLPPRSTLVSEDVRFLLVHHSDSPNNSPVDPRDTIRAIYEFHTGPAKGWPDVCYQFFVDAAGGIWEGRAGALDGPVVADATGGSQGFAQLVCLLGSFNTTLPTPAARASLVTLLAWLADRSGLDTSAGATATFVSRGSQRWARGTSVTTPTVTGHRAMSYTDCPGDAFWPYVRDVLQGDVHEARAALANFPAPDDGSGNAVARRGTRRTVTPTP